MNFEICWKFSFTSFDYRAIATICAPDENTALKAAMAVFEFEPEDIIYIKAV